MPGEQYSAVFFQGPAFALVIGISKYDHGQLPDDEKKLDDKNFRYLKVAAKDARDFAEFLETHGFRPGCVTLLPDEQATSRNIKDHFWTLAQRCKDRDTPNPLVIVY